LSSTALGSRRAGPIGQWLALVRLLSQFENCQLGLKLLDFTVVGIFARIQEHPKLFLVLNQQDHERIDQRQHDRAEDKCFVAGADFDRIRTFGS
jgi:hypothetical protein